MTNVSCPRAKSEMTPCVARDGHLACADDGVCVGCGEHPADLLQELVPKYLDLKEAIREVQAVCNAIESDAAGENFPSWEARQTAEVIYGHLTRALAPLAELESSND